MRTAGMILGLFLCTTAAAQSPPDATDYNLACGADQRVSDAVERTLQGLSRLIRPLARPRLRQASDWCRKYRFDVQGDAISVHCDGQPKWSPTLTDSTRPYTDPEGRVGVLAVQTSDSRIDVTTRFDEGERQTVFEFDGDVVRVRESIRSPQLEIPVEWELVYERDPAAIAEDAAVEGD